VGNSSNQTICHHLLNIKNRKNICVEHKIKKKWQTISWAQYYDQVEKAAGGLKVLGVGPKQKVAILSNTRLEWALSDMAALGLGAVVVPIYQSSLAEEIAFILKDSGAETIIFESEDVYKKFEQVKSKVPHIKNSIGMTFSKPGVIGWEELLNSGAKYRKDHPNFFQQACLDTDIQDLATIVYTSGTTGSPKGVCLHHEQIISEVGEVFKLIDVDNKDKTLTFLPFAHIFGRVEHWSHVYMGFTMAYAESVDRVRDNLLKTKPTFLLAVPRIFEKIYTSMQTQSEASPLKSKLFKWALDVGYKMSDCKLNKKLPPLTVLLEYQVAKRMVFDKLMKKLGGRLRFAVSGGAPLSAEISKFFHASNLLILEGYGLTETTAAVFLNTPFNYKFGSVGQPLGEVTVKIAEDGEICVKSKKVMKQYHNNPEATAEVFDDEGFFKTGDIGELDSGGFLKITDRKKDLIKTAGGKYVAPQKLENMLKLDKNISNVLIHGDQKKYIVSLITLNPETMKSFALSHQIAYKDMGELSKNPKVKDLIRNAVAQTNSQLASYETIKNFAILPNDFTVENGELTPSLKVKRKLLDKKYESQIKALYGGEEAGA
jgi:long-chain acyl-CoA synthetase